MGHFRWIKYVNGTSVNGATTPLTYTIDPHMSNNPLFSEFVAGCSVTGVSGAWGARLIATLEDGAGGLTSVSLPVMGVTAITAAGVKYMSVAGNTTGVILSPTVFELQPAAASWTRSFTGTLFVMCQEPD